MWWMAAMAVAQGLEKAKEVKSQAKLDKFTMKSNIKVDKLVTQASNTMAKAKGDLARFQQANSNKYKLMAGADSVESQRVNMLRLADEGVRGSMEARIGASEAAGALMAAAGAAGVGGGSVNMIDATNRIRTQRAQELADRNLDTQLYDAQRNIDQTWEATVLGLDDIQFNDSINYMQPQESYIKEPSWGAIGLQAGMTFAQTYNSMGGFDSLKTKMPGWLGGNSNLESFGTAAGKTLSIP